MSIDMKNFHWLKMSHKAEGQEVGGDQLHHFHSPSRVGAITTTHAPSPRCYAILRTSISYP